MRDTLPFQAHSSTSRRAAHEFEGYAKTKRYQVFAFIAENPGVSDRRIQDSLCMNPSTQRPRRIELENAGLIVKVGETPSPGAMNLYSVTGEEYPLSPGAFSAPKRTCKAPQNYDMKSLLIEACDALEETRDLFAMAKAMEIREKIGR